MVIQIEVNNKSIQAQKGETILSALSRNGVQVPTICSMKELTPSGACRMCVVEVEGNEHLVPACSYPVEEWMKIRTHSPRVLRARKTNVELLLSDHPDDCLYCERNGNCELQKLAEDLHVRERRIPGRKSNYKSDNSSPGIIRDPAKCILCGRCVRICEEIVGVATLDFVRRGSDLQIATTMSKPLNFSNCIQCGQCVISCPTGALTEHMQFPELEASLHHPEKTVVAHYTPAVVASLAEEFHLKKGSDVKGLINAALRKSGFDFVFDGSFGGEVTIMEQAGVFKERVKKGGSLPLLSSSCPGWVTYVEQYRPELIPHLSEVRSPQQVIGGLIKTWFAELNHLDPARIFSVAITSCTAAKQESQRVELSRKGVNDIDAVLTTRELARLIRLNGIDMEHLEPESSDAPFHAQSSAGRMFAVAGGETEVFARTAFKKFNRKEMPVLRLNKFRGARDMKETQIQTSGGVINLVAVNGLKKALRLLDEVKAGKKKVDFIEVMACPEGCINGGGQPIPAGESILKNRMRTIYDIDNKETIKVAHRSGSAQRLYEEYLSSDPGKRKSELLHTRYSEKEALL